MTLSKASNERQHTGNSAFLHQIIVISKPRTCLRIIITIQEPLVCVTQHLHELNWNFQKAIF